MQRPSHTRGLSLSAVIAGAVILATGCDGGARPAQPLAASQPGDAKLGAARDALTPEESAAAAAHHDQFASAGLQCASCHPCGASPVHALAWMDQASPAFHAYAANGGLSGCQGCHGPALDGAGGSSSIACADCHGPGWATNCTMCHGGTDDATGAPPKVTWGNAGDAVRVGAHGAHVGATHGLANAIDCGACHVKPADALAAGHVDASPAEVVFAGLATQGVTSAPTWTRSSATCAGTYCHGATLAGGSRKTPIWTATDGTQRTCTSCHGAPPPSGRHGEGDHRVSCGYCHAAGYTSSSVNGALHVNGVREVQGSRIRTWNPVTRSCQPTCHGTERWDGGGG